MAAGLTNIGLGIKGLVAGPQGAQEQKLKAFNSLRQAYEDSTTSGGIPISGQAKAEQEVNRDILNSQGIYMTNAGDMSEDQRYIAQYALDNQRAAGKRKVQAAAAYDAANEAYGDVRRQSGIPIETAKQLEGGYVASNRIGAILQPTADENYNPAAALNVRTDNLEKNLKNLGIDEEKINEIIKRIESIGRAAQGAEDDVKNLDNTLKELEGDEGLINRKVGEVEENLTPSEDQDLDTEGLRTAAINRADAKDTKDFESDNFKSITDNLNNQNSNVNIIPPSNTEKIVSAASALMGLSQAITSVNNALDIANDKTISLSDKIITLGTSGTSAIFSLSMAAQQLVKTFSIFSKLGAGATFGILAGVAAAFMALSFVIEKVQEKINAFEIGQEKTTELFSNLDEQKKKLDSLETSLKSIQDRIRELQNTRGLDLVQQEELAELQAEQTSIQAEIELQKQLYEIELQRVELEASKNLAPINSQKLEQKKPRPQAPLGLSEYSTIGINNPEDYQKAFVLPLQELIALFEKKQQEALTKDEQNRLDILSNTFNAQSKFQAELKLEDANKNLTNYKIAFSEYYADINDQISTATSNYLNYIKVLKAQGKEVGDTDTTIQGYQSNLKVLRMAMVDGNEEEYNKKYLNPALSDMARGENAGALDQIYTDLATGVVTSFDQLDTELQKVLSDFALYKGISVEDLFTYIQGEVGSGTAEKIKIELEADDGTLKEQINSLTAEQWEIFFNLIANDIPVQEAIAAALAYDGSTITLNITAADEAYNKMQAIVQKVQNGEAITDKDLTFLSENGIDTSSATRAPGGGWNFAPEYLGDNVNFLKQASIDGYDKIVDDWAEKYYGAKNRDNYNDKSDFIFDTKGGDKAIIMDEDGSQVSSTTFFTPSSNTSLAPVPSGILLTPLTSELGLTRQEGVSELKDRAAFLGQYSGQTYSIEQEDGSALNVDVDNIIGKINTAIESGKVDEMNAALAESADLINTIGHEYADAGLIDQETLWAAQAAEVAEFNEELSHFGYTMEDLVPYMEKIKKSNPKWKEQGVDIKRQAMAMKALEDGLSDYEDSLKELEDAEKDVSSTTEDISLAFDRYHKNVEKIVGQKLDKEFTKVLRAAGQLDPKILRTEQGIQQLNKTISKMQMAKAVKKEGDELTKTLEKIADGTEDSTELFKEWGTSLNVPTDKITDFASNVTTALDGIKPLNAGDLVTGDVATALDGVLADLQAGGMSLQTALQEMEKLGVEPVISAEQKTVPGYTATTSAYSMHGQYQGQYEVGPASIKYTPEFETGTAVVPDTTVSVPKIEFRKKGDGTANGANLGSGKTGGGGGGGGGSKPTPPKPLKRIDPKVRYEGTQKRIDNLKKKQDQIEEKKEAAFGKEKIKQAEKEIELKQRQIKLQTQYMEETKEALDLQKIDVSDRLSKITNVEIEFDVDGSVKNLDKIEEAILNIENHIINLENAGADEFEIAAWQEKLEMAREGFDDLLQIIEDNLDAENAFFEAINELADLNLELVQIKVDLDISLAEAELEYIDYLLEKLTDEGFEAAEAITVLGDKANNALGQIETYRKGIAEILANRGLSVDDLMNMDADDLIGLGFTQAEIDALLEYRSAIIENMSTLNELRAEMIDKVSAAFGAFSDELSRQIDLFEHYSGLLEHFGEIATLTGSRFAKSELRDLFSSIDNAAMVNGQANIRAAKSNLEDLRSMYEAYMTSYAEAKKQAGLGENDTIFEYEETRKEMEDSLREAEETFYSAWEDTLSKATDILERWVEDAGARFEEVLSPMYKSLDRLEEAYDRTKEQDENYYDNYEQLYYLSQLTRDISNSIDDTDNIKGKQRLRDLMKEITDIQARGVELSEYDVDVLRKRYELEQARQALEDASDNASLVRLQRDQEGNWGYVYTADEDAVDEAEKEYENKLYELQKANDEYIKELQDRILELTTDCKEQLADIAADTTLSPEEKERLSKEISDFYNSQLEYLTSQMDGALANQNATLGLMLSIYNTTKDQLLDTWEETNLSLLGMYNNTGDMFAGLTGAMKGYIEDLWEGIQNFDNNLNNTNIAAGSTDAFGTLADEIGKIGENTEETEQAVESLGDTFVSEFETIMTEVTRFEEIWETQIDAAIDKNEEFVSSLLEVISLLALVNTDDKEFTDAYNEYKAAQQKYLESLDGTVSPSTIRYGLVETNDPEWEAAKKKFEEFMTQWMAKHSGGIMDSGEAFDTGGYTGEWGPEGRLAWLHQKELILNPVDTENLLDAVAMVKTLELNVGAFTDRLSEVIPSMMTMERGAFQQEIYITAEFTEATSAAEIQEAFENLINDATQYAYSR